LTNCQKPNKSQKCCAAAKAQQLSGAAFATASQTPPSGVTKSSGRPYKQLFIYHLKGHLVPGTKLSGHNFIGNWQEDKFSFLFFYEPSAKQLQQLLAAQPQLTLLDNYSMTYDEWQGGNIAPLRIGRLHIVPPWSKLKCEAQAQKALRPILLDPGVVFGAGTHSTTCGCLEALDLLFREKLPRSALDLGTGTGILALASARLGCRQTIAVDINFLATRTARQNIRLNHLENRVMAVQGNAENLIDLPTDLVIANMHYEVIKRLLLCEGFFHKKWFILSGLFYNQAKDVIYKLARRSVRVIKIWKHDRVWQTLLAGNVASVFR
jgi:ribosomal protein L11 methyltransferase